MAQTKPATSSTTARNGERIRKTNPTGTAALRVARLQKLAQAADQKYQAALVKDFGKRAGDMRYQPQKQSAATRALGKAARDLNDELHNATGEMRAKGESVNPTKNAPKGAVKGHRAVSQFFGTQDIDIIFNAQPERAMRVLSERHGKGYGVEHIDAKEFKRSAGSASIRGIDYVNMGDPYARTLIHDGQDFFIGAWGDLIEKHGSAKNPSAKNYPIPGGRMVGGSFVAHGGRPMNQRKHAERDIKQLLSAKKTWDGRPLDAAGREYNRELAREVATRHGLPMPGENPSILSKVKRSFEKLIKGAKGSPKAVATLTQGKYRADIFQHSPKAFSVEVTGDRPTPFQSMAAAMSFARVRLHEVAAVENQGVAGLEQVLGGRDSVTGKLLKKLGRRNPQDSAEKMYEVFHGLPSTQVLQYKSQEHAHEWLWAVGTLTSITVVRNGKSITFEAPNPDSADFAHVVMVCATEDGKQIYFCGGDQSLPLEDLEEEEKFNLTDDDIRDHMLIGEVRKLIYRTHKIFESRGEVAIDFYHLLGKEHAGGVLPVLEYKPLNPSMELVGGRYKVAPFEKSLGASPGVVG